MKNAKKVVDAAIEFLKRKSRLSHPVGSFDNAKRWYPDEQIEHCECCDHVRSPSRTWPMSYMTHCRSAAHVATLFKVDASDLRKTANLLQKFKTGSGEESDVKKLIKLLNNKSTAFYALEACNVEKCVVEKVLISLNFKNIKLNSCQSIGL